MAKRPIYIPIIEGNTFVKTEILEFTWYSGLAKTQKQKSIESLHEVARKNFRLEKILEISTKSKKDLGISLSAFNLLIDFELFKKKVSVESVYQASKVFEKGGPYYDLINKSSRIAKKDFRLINSGSLIKFLLLNEEWSLEPKTAFYNWIYLNALKENELLSKEVCRYSAFTDIEFNPIKSINCQAYSAALFVSMTRRNILKKGLSSKEFFLSLVYGKAEKKTKEEKFVQASLF